MSSLIKKVFDKYSYFNYIIGILCGIVAFLMMLIIMYDVAMRYFMNSPTIWADEISCYLLIIITFLGVTYTDMNNGHIKVEMFINLLQESKRIRLQIILEIITLLFFSIYSLESWKMVYDSYISHNISTTLLRTPMYVPQSFLALGVSLFALHIFLKLMLRLTNQ